MPAKTYAGYSGKQWVGVAIIAVLVLGVAAPTLAKGHLSFFGFDITVSNPNPPTPVGQGIGPGVYLTGAVNSLDPGASYGIILIYQGTQKLTTCTLANGAFTTSVPVISGGSYTFYYNGSSYFYPDAWTFYVPTFVPAGQPGANAVILANGATGELVSPSGGFIIYPIAPSFTDLFMDQTNAVAMSRASGGNPSRVNDTAITHSATSIVQFSFSTTVATPYAARAPQAFTHPAYPLPNGAQLGAYFVLFTNSTNAFLASGSPGTFYRIGSSFTVFVIPVPMAISGLQPSTSGTVNFGILFPTQCHLLVSGGLAWYTAQGIISNAMPSTFATIPAPSGYTLGSFLTFGITGPQTAGLWAVA